MSKDPDEAEQQNDEANEHLPEVPPEPARVRAQLPLIRGDGTLTINPSPEELDDSLWD